MISATEVEDPGRDDVGFGEHEAERLRLAALPALEHPRPLKLFEASCRRMGMGGSLALAKTVYLAATTRVLARESRLQAHLHVLGPASAGKTFEAEAALKHLHDDATRRYDGSPRVLIYSPDLIKHRVVYYGEIDNLPVGNGEDDAMSTAMSFLRTLTADGKATYSTVVKAKGGEGFTVQTRTKEGPALLLVTGTRRIPDEQLASRLHEVEVLVDRTRLESVVAAQGRLMRGAASHDPDPAIIALQEYLQALAPLRVTIPYAEQLGRAVLVAARVTDPRLTREYLRVCGFTAAHALLSIERRDRDESGAIIATIEDYSEAREVIRELSTTREFTSAQIEVWKAVSRVHTTTNKPVAVRDVRKELLKDHNTIRKAINALLAGGALDDARESKSRTAPHLVVPNGADPARVALPDPAALAPKRPQVFTAEGVNLGAEAIHLGAEVSPMTDKDLSPLRRHAEVVE